MVNRNEVVENIKTQLDKWNGEIDNLQKKAESASGDVKTAAQQKVEEAKKLRTQVQAKFEEAQTAGEDKLNDIADKSQKALSELKTGVENAAAALKS